MGDSTVNYLTNRTKNLTKKVKMKFLLFSTFVILTAARTKRSADNGACGVFESTKATEKAKVVEDGVTFTYTKGVCTPADNAKCETYETTMDAAKTLAEKTQGVKIKEGVCGGSFALQLSVLLCFMYNLLK